MTTEQKIIKTKLRWLELAVQLGNVQQSCRVIGYSRDSFYRFQELYGICNPSTTPCWMSFIASRSVASLTSNSKPLQADLDAFVDEYNYRRPHQDRRCYGKTRCRRFSIAWRWRSRSSLRNSAR